ncbi:MAG: hypothetical protein NTW19_01610 [Planctomycetota bacterium]|nr:hypothetical protein [Planctomycetota bacterium]
MPATSLAPRDLGVPVKSVNWVRLFAGKTRAGAPLLLACMGQDAGDFFVCLVDLQTGHCEQYPCNLKHAAFPTAAHFDPQTGLLYVGSSYTGHLHRFDPNLPPAQRRLEDLGRIDPADNMAIFPCRIDVSPDGGVWIGAYGGCSLTRFDPKTNEFRRLGRMDETDMYFYPLCGSDGTVAGLVRVCNPHTVVIDAKTGEHRTVGPTLDTNAGPAAGGGLSAKHLDLVKGGDGLLYIKASTGNLRLRGMTAEPVDAIPEGGTSPTPEPTFPDGSKAKFLDDKSFTFRRVAITKPDGTSREISLDWVGGGTTVFLVHDGPDGKLYGSSILPEHLFRSEPDGSNMVDLGQCSVSGGEAYSMANLGGKIYIASYPAARLSIYDPAKSYRFGEDEQANPRDIGRLDDVAYRPRVALAGPAGKVWVGSVPDYGMWGGTLASYDPAAAKIVSHRHLMQDCSVVSMDWLPDLGLILVGMTIHGGSGTQPKAKVAGFVLWDPVKDAAVWSGTMGLDHIDGVPDICRAGDGTVYATVVSVIPAASKEGKSETIAELVVLDVKGRKVLDRFKLGGEEGWPMEVSMRRGPGGKVFGATKLQVYRLEAGSARPQALWRCGLKEEEQHIGSAGAIIGKTYYFSCGHKVRAIEVG